MEEKFKQILDDEEFAEKLANAGSPDEFVALLNEKGIVLEEGLTAEEAFDIFKKGEGEELSEDSLENVAGGFGVVAAIGVGVLIAVGANAIAFAGGYIYQKIKNKRRR